MQTKTPARRGPVRRALRAVGAAVRKAFDLVGITSTSWFIGLTSALWGDRSYEALKSGTLANPYAARAYELIINAIRPIEWLAYVWRIKEGKDTLDELPSHDFVDVLARPNRDMTWQRFMGDALDDLFFGGEIITYAPGSPITGANAGKPGSEGLRLIRPDKIIRVERSDDAKEEVTFYHYRTRRGVVERIPAGRVRRFYLIEDPDRPGRGWPLAAAAARTVELMAKGEEWTGSLFDDKGRMPGWFVFKGDNGQTMQEEDFKRFKEELQASYAKDRAAGMPGLIENMEFQQNGMTPREAEAVAVELQGMRRIAVAWGVMTPLLGDAQNMTYDNLKTARRALLTLTALPLLEWLQAEMSAAYMGMYSPDEAYLSYSADAIEELQEDTNALYTRAREACGRPFISANEARETTGWQRLTKDPEADILWAPTSVAPAGTALDDLVEGPEPSGDGQADEEDKTLAVSIRMNGDSLYRPD